MFMFSCVIMQGIINKVGVDETDTSAPGWCIEQMLTAWVMKLVENTCMFKKSQIVIEIPIKILK